MAKNIKKAMVHALVDDKGNIITKTVSPTYTLTYRKTENLIDDWDFLEEKGYTIEKFILTPIQP